MPNNRSTENSHRKHNNIRTSKKNKKTKDSELILKLVLMYLMYLATDNIYRTILKVNATHCNGPDALLFTKL